MWNGAGLALVSGLHAPCLPESLLSFEPFGVHDAGPNKSDPIHGADGEDETECTLEYDVVDFKRLLRSHSSVFDGRRPDLR